MNPKMSIWKQLITQKPLLISDTHPVHIHCHDSEPEESAEFQYDMHYGIEIGIVLEGCMEREVADGSRRKFSRGDVWFDGIWEPHGWRAAPDSMDSRLRRTVLFVWPPFIRNLYFPETPDIPWMQPFVTEPQHRPRITAAMRPEVLRMERELVSFENATGKRDLLRVRSLVIDLLALILENTKKRPMPEATISSSLSHQLSPAISLAFESREPVKVPDAAAACGMAVSSFSRQFKEAMGITFGVFALRRRLQSVAETLVTTDIPLRKIAEEWGFCDQSHLSRAFETYYKCSPAQYRAGLRKAH